MTTSDAWRACLAAFLLHLHDRSGSRHTVVGYGSVLDRFLAYCDPGRATRADIESFIRLPSRGVRNHGQPPSAATRNRYLSYVSSFYRYAQSFEYNGAPLFTKANPASGIVHGKEPRIHRGFTDAELSQLFSVLPPDSPDALVARDRALLLLLFTSARRSSEVRLLLWRDLEHVTFVEGGRRRQGVRFRFKGKGKGEQVDFCEYPRQAYEALLHSLKVSNRLEAMQPESALFIAVGPPQNGGRFPISQTRPLDASAPFHILKRVCERAGLDPQKFCIHGLRHCAARVMWESGADLRLIQHTLRHQSLDMCQKYLGEIISDGGDQNISLLEQKFSSLL